MIAVWEDGINTVASGNANQLAQNFDAKTVGPYRPPERKRVEQGYRTIPFPYLEFTPPAFHMEALWTRDQLLGYISTWPATSRHLKATSRCPIKPLAVDLKRVGGEVGAPRQIVGPLHLCVGRKPR